MSATPPLLPTSARHSLVRRQIITAGAMTAVALVVRASPARADPDSEILDTEEAIHQERIFRAERSRVYEALTVERQFDRIIQLSGVMKAAAPAHAQHPTKLSPRAGGSFALFGGYIVGRQIELVPNELIVQAWRVQNWARGIYSIARFELSDQGQSTKLVFDHTGFPKGDAGHLASGWQEHYWGPLATLLG
jgi:activator of HSP90 ATPase